jgi:alpha-glucosidase
MPDTARQDPNWTRSGRTERGRDGCRVPLPWVAGVDGFGFTEGVPWLPQPDDFEAYARDRQEEQPDSTLRLYAAALAWRRRLSLATGTLRWVSGPADPVLDFATAGLRVTVNLGEEPWRLPAGAELLQTSAPVIEGVLESDTAAWWRAG